MTRITTTLLMMLILLNGSVVVMEGSGLTDDIGVTLSPGVDKAVDDTLEDAKRGFSSNAGAGDTLIALFGSAVGAFNIFIHGVFSLPDMFLNLGFPEWIVFPLFAPVYLLSALELAYAATGRDLV